VSRTPLGFDGYLHTTIRGAGGIDRRGSRTTLKGSNRSPWKDFEAQPVELDSRKATVPGHHLRTRAGCTGGT